jgi:hypothetical protein
MKLKTFTKLYYCYKDLINTILVLFYTQRSNQKGISHSCFYDNVINKAKKFKSDT